MNDDIGGRNERCAERFTDAEFGSFDTLLDLKIPGMVEKVAPTVEHIMERIRSVGCAAGGDFEIEVALLEGLGNAVEHGCRCDPEKTVEIWVGCHDERGLVVVIRDPGPGFDPQEIPSPVEEENLLRTHGRGVWLINRLMDEVHYDSGGTELRMHKVPRTDADDQ